MERRFELVIIEGDNWGERTLVDEFPFTIGSADECSLMLEDGGVAEVHAEIAVVDGAFRVLDRSLRGIMVNEHRVSDRVLRSGDLVMVGEAMLLFTCETERVPEAELDPTVEHDSELVEAINGAFEQPHYEVMEIPRLFHSVYKDGPFEECLLCSEPLSARGEYFVEKVFRGNQVAMECAICQPCAVKMQQEFSEESRKRLEAHDRQLRERPPSLVRCCSCSKLRAEVREYNLFGLGMGRRMVKDSFFFLCEECVLAVQELLSKQTRDVYREFITTHFPGIPADMPRPVLAF